MSTETGKWCAVLGHLWRWPSLHDPQVKNLDTLQCVRCGFVPRGGA